MCPLCLTTAAITIASTAGAAGAATAIAVRVKRALGRAPSPQAEPHEDRAGAPPERHQEAT